MTMPRPRRSPAALATRWAAAALLVAAGAAGATESFDAVTFTPPPGWARQAGQAMLAFIHQRPPAGYCTLALYQARASSGDADADFKADWAELALHAGAYQGQVPAATRRQVDGWTVTTGVAKVRRTDGGTGSALLADFTGGGRSVSVVAQFSDDSYLPEIRRFVDGVRPQAPAPAQARPTTAAAAGGSKMRRGTARWTGAPVVGVWMGYRNTGSIETSVVDGDPELQLGQLKPRWLTFLADGTFFEGLPRHGLWALEPAAEQRADPDGAAFWGTWRADGSAVSAVNRLGRTLGWRLQGQALVEDAKTTGGTTFHRAASVDGLVLDGTFSSFRLWKDSDAGPRWHGRPVIRFGRDGRFEDLGAFLNNPTEPLEASPPEHRPGSGRYAIEGFTLMLRYDDGREAHHSLTPPMKRTLDGRSDVLFVGQAPFYRR